MDWKFVLVLIFSLLVAVFTMQNAEAVNIQFLGFEFTQVSQALVILISAVAGAVIVLLFSAIRWVKDKSKMMVAKRSITALETQVKLLQTKLDAEIAKNMPPNVMTNATITVSDTVEQSENVDPEPLPELVADPEKPGMPGEPEEPELKRKWYQR